MTVRLWTAFSSGRGEDLARGQDQDVLEDGLAPLLLALLAGLEPDDVDAMAGKDEAGDARLLVDLDGEGPHPLGMLATRPGGVPFGPSFFSTITSPSSMVVLTQRSSTSLNEENAPTGTADFTMRIVLTMSALRTSSSLKSRAATRMSCVSSSLAGGLLIIRRVRSMAPRPRTTARTSITIDLPFIAASSLSTRRGVAPARCCRILGSCESAGVVGSGEQPIQPK